MRIGNSGFGLVLVACMSPALAQTQLSLADAVEAAWGRGSQSTEVAGQVRRARAGYTTAAALWAAPPAVELGTTRNRQYATAPRRETEIGLAVPLWLPGQRAARLGQAEAEVNAASATAEAARLQVAEVVREAAAEVALQRAELAATQAQTRELEMLARDVESRVAAGDLARADALAANAERLAAVSAQAQSGQRLQAAELRWFALTGLKDVPELPADAIMPAQEHPALRAAIRNVEAARERVNVAQTSRRDAPEVLLRARQELASGEPNTHGVGVALRIPFGTADRNEPLMAAALSELELAQATERELRLQLEAELATAQLAQASARQQLADESARASLLRERANLIEKSFKAGETALPDMLRAVTAATQAQAAVARAQAALAQATSRLQQAQGIMP